MLARSAKPKLSLSISTASQRPSLSLSTGSVAMPRTPISPASPIQSRYTSRSFATAQQPSSYAYSNSASSQRSILKKTSGSSSSSARSSSSGKRLQFSGEPTVYCVTPIENKDYYGAYVKMSKEERRWARQ